MDFAFELYLYVQVFREWNWVTTWLRTQSKNSLQNSHTCAIFLVYRPYLAFATGLLVKSIEMLIEKVALCTFISRFIYIHISEKAGFCLVAASGQMYAVETNFPHCILLDNEATLLTSDETAMLQQSLDASSHSVLLQKLKQILVDNEWTKSQQLCSCLKTPLMRLCARYFTAFVISITFVMRLATAFVWFCWKSVDTELPCGKTIISILDTLLTKKEETLL